MSSSNTYTLKIDIDDSKIRDIEKRLMNIVGGGQSGGLGSKMESAAGGGSSKDMIKNIGKLGLIATGVLAIVGIMQKLSSMLVESSPMLSQMLKLLNFGILLILRPIGDFFGFFLRPLMIYFIRSIALPWYNLSRPIMQKLGQFLGLGIVKNLTDADKNRTSALDPAFDAEAGFGNIKAMILEIGAWYDLIIPGSYEDTKKAIADLEKFWGDTQKWIDGFKFPDIVGLATGLATWVTEQLDKLPDFWVWFKGGIRSWINGAIQLLPNWDAITTGVNSWIATNLSFLPSWEDVTSKITSIKDTLITIIESIKQFFVDIAASIGIDISNILTEKPTPVPVPTNGYEDNNNNTDFSPWLVDSPTERLSAETKGR